MKLLRCLADIPEDRPVLIYGSGTAGSRFGRVLRTYRPELRIRGYLDSFTEGRWEGLPQYHFSRLDAEFLQGDSVVITSAFWREIEMTLKEATDNYWIVPDRFYQGGIFDIYQQKVDPVTDTLFDQYFAARDWQDPGSPLHQVRALFERDQDRQLYGLLTAEFAKTTPVLDAIYNYYYRQEFGRQYFENIDYHRVATVIEGGVFDGYDTLEFLKQTHRRATIYCFDPDEESLFSSRYFAELMQAKQFKHQPLGLWSEPANLTLWTCPGANKIVPYGANLPSERVQQIKVTSLDRFVEEQEITKVDLIKMDIEGAEMEALQGAAKVIAEHKPQLAICLYHKKEHFIDIPLYLKKLNPDYRFRLGHYNADHTETVLYALVD